MKLLRSISITPLRRNFEAKVCLHSLNPVSPVCMPFSYIWYTDTSSKGHVATHRMLFLMRNGVFWSHCLPRYEENLSGSLTTVIRSYEFPYSCLNLSEPTLQRESQVFLTSADDEIILSWNKYRYASIAAPYFEADNPSCGETRQISASISGQEALRRAWRHWGITSDANNLVFHFKITTNTNFEMTMVVLGDDWISVRVLECA